MFEQGATSHLPEESREDTTDPVEGAPRRAPALRAPRDAGLGAEATPKDREPHDHLLKKSRRDVTGPESARESASVSTLANTSRGSDTESASAKTSAKGR